MIPAIDAIAHQIEEEWAASGYDPSAFPRFAKMALAACELPSLQDLIVEICRSPALPQQRRADQGFGQPGITLFSRTTFEIEVLFWHTGTPAIHQHSFDGAFRIIRGRSAEGIYTFAPNAEWDGLVTGELSLTRFGVLNSNQISEIRRGNELIHSAFHLDTPSVTLVARTRQDDTPELTYLPPGIAYNTANRRPEFHKKLQVLDLLARVRDPDYSSAVDASLDHAAASEVLEILLRIAGHDIADEVFCRLLRLGCGKLPQPVGSSVAAASVEHRRRHKLIAQRSVLLDADDRFVLAAMISFRDRSSLKTAILDYAGDLERAELLVAAATGKIIGGDEMRQQLGGLAVNFIFADRGFDEYTVEVAKRRGSELTHRETAILAKLFSQVRSYPSFMPFLQS